MNESPQNAADNQLPNSAVRYEDVDISSVDYEPSEPFRGIVVSGAGNIIITGLDGVDSPAMAVPAGIHPLGGLAIVRTGTTATIDAALF